MDLFLRMITANAVAATILALVAGAVATRRRNPAVLHVLWMLVLAKLLVPAPLGLGAFPTPGSGGRTAGAATGAHATASPPTGAIPAAVTPAVGTPDVVTPAAEPAAGVPGPATTGGELAATSGHRSGLLAATDARAAAMVVALLGTLLVLGAAAVRVVRFRRLVRTADPVPAPLERRIARIASALGLRGPPTVRVLAAHVPPVLWPGPPCEILLPGPLLQELSEDELDSLLAHELAHVRRRDHWTRILELLATALFWWHPVAWWARHNLRAAEEASCDALVVRSFGGRPRAYADALLKTIEFLGRAPARPVPALATGAGDFPRLKERLTMIVSGKTPRPLSPRTRWALAALALAGLIVGPSWTAQAELARKAPPAPAPLPPDVAALAAPDAPAPAAPDVPAVTAPDAPAPVPPDVPDLAAPDAAAPAPPAAKLPPLPEPPLMNPDPELGEALRKLHLDSAKLDRQMLDLQERRELLQLRMEELNTELRALDVAEEASRLEKDGHAEQAKLLLRQVDLQREQLDVRKMEIEQAHEQRLKQLELETKLREIDLQRAAAGAAAGNREALEKAVQEAEQAARMSEFHEQNAPESPEGD